MDYKKGERVIHPGVPEWGVGKVLADSRDHKVRVFFSGDGPKTLSLRHVEPLKISGTEAEDPVLDHLWIKEGGTNRYRSLEASKALFLRDYPEGFYDQAYLDHERKGKVAAHALALDLIGRETLGELVAEKKYEEIGKRVQKVVNATNLIFPNEKLAFKKCLKDPQNLELFSEHLYQLLYGEGDLEARFVSFAGTLGEIKVAKWATLTYFLFIVFPEKYIFIKPIVTLLAAEISAFEIHFRPDLNWKTYRSVLSFSKYFQDGLKDLKPRDMIDIQSFMWCIGPDK
jgi:hypothetical protein